MDQLEKLRVDQPVEYAMIDYLSVYRDENGVQIFSLKILIDSLER